MYPQRGALERKPLEYYKIYFPADCGRPEIAAGEISAIAKGPDGKIWFTDGASMVYWEKGYLLRSVFLRP